MLKSLPFLPAYPTPLHERGLGNQVFPLSTGSFFGKTSFNGATLRPVCGVPPKVVPMTRDISAPSQRKS